jgi:polyisoprenoid-binding protein YceI
MTLATKTTPTPIAASPAAPATAPVWTIDGAHTDILFSAKHMMVTTVRGKFHDVDGTLVLDETDPTRSSADIRIEVESLNTGSAPRDAHLRSADFFDVETYPFITFRSTAVEHVRGDDYRITGDLTIRETTRPATFDATFLGFYTGMQGGRRAGLSARTRINRKDWGLGWNVALETGGWLVGEEVTIEIEVAVDQVS